jgi:YVTN family beta-propeller protein
MAISAKSLRRSVLLAAVAALFACVAAASASAAPLAYTVNYETGTVSAINTATNQIVGQPIKVGTEPYSVAVTPNGQFAYVASLANSDVVVINTATRQAVGSPIPVGEDPFQVAISPNGEFAYVTNEGSETLSVISTQTNTVVKTIELEGTPWGVSVTPDGKFAYVTLEDKSAVEVISTERLVSVGQIAVGEKPVNVVFTPNGTTAYVVNDGSESVSVVNTATRQEVGTIPVGEEPWGIALTPNAAKAYVVNYGNDTVSVINATTNQVVGQPIPVGEEPYDVAITPDGKTAYVAEYNSQDVAVINTATDTVVGAPIDFAGQRPWQIVVAPDQSPTAAYTPPAAVIYKPMTLNGAASSDPDGTISSYAWAFGDGATGTGVEPSHTYTATGEYAVKLSVVDNEGCGEAEVFTGRTAYCSGAASSVTHTVTAYPPPNNFGFKRLVHNRNNGTVRMQVKLPGEGELVLTGPQVHMVRKKKAPAGLVWMTLHPRVEVNKRLKKVNHLRIRVQVKFTPVGGTTKTKSRSLQLLRKAKKKHHHG